VPIVGQGGQTGAYVLRIVVQRDLRLSFGRFDGGRRVRLPAAEYVYAGSAMAPRGAGSLGPRLLRHATRSGRRPPHLIRDQLLADLARAGLRGAPCRAKHAHWHVDYLLDHPAVDLIDALVVRAASRLEHRLAAWLAADPGIVPAAAGLGASDAPGATHLLRVVGPLGWWDAWLASRLPDLECLACG
jgi:Uri superfamily endonuclease